MFTNILIPLDGSKLAEASIPPALLLSKKLNTSITLFHVIETNAPRQIHGDHHLVSYDQAKQYLADIAQRYFPAEIQITCHVHEEDVHNVARSIADHVGELKQDLIVMCSHGESGLRNWMVGNISQQVIGYTKIPLVLIPLDNQGKAVPTEFRSFLVAMDGEEEHDRGLTTAAELGLAVESKIRLVTVVHTIDSLSGENAAARRLLPSAMKAMLNFTGDEARSHLEEHATEWRKKGLEVTIEVRRGEPASEIIRCANEHKNDLIVVGTHGKAGWEAFWAGSVAPRIVTQSNIPILLVPANSGV